MKRYHLFSTHFIGIKFRKTLKDQNWQEKYNTTLQCSFKAMKHAIELYQRKNQFMQNVPADHYRLKRIRITS